MVLFTVLLSGKPRGYQDRLTDVLADSKEQDQTARNVQSDLESKLSYMAKSIYENKFEIAEFRFLLIGLKKNLSFYSKIRVTQSITQRWRKLTVKLIKV